MKNNKQTTQKTSLFPRSEEERVSTCCHQAKESLSHIRRGRRSSWLVADNHKMGCECHCAWFCDFSVCFSDRGTRHSANRTLLGVFYNHRCIYPACLVKGKRDNFSGKWVKMKIDNFSKRFHNFLGFLCLVLTLQFLLLS